MTSLATVRTAFGSPRRAATLGGLVAVALLASISLQVSSPGVIWHPAPDAAPGATLVGPAPWSASASARSALGNRAAAVAAVCLVFVLAVATGAGALAAAGAALALAFSGLFWTRAAGAHEVALATCLALATVGSLIAWNDRPARRVLALLCLAYALTVLAFAPALAALPVLALAASRAVSFRVRPALGVACGLTVAAAAGVAASWLVDGGSATWRAWFAPRVWTTFTGRVGDGVPMLVTDFGILGLGFLAAGVARLAIDRSWWLGVVGGWSLALGAWVLASADPDWRSGLLPALVPLWLVAASGMAWACAPWAERGRRPAAVVLVLLLPAMSAITNRHLAGEARAGRAFVERYVAGLARLAPGAPMAPTSLAVVERGFSLPGGAVTLAGAQATLRQLGFHYTPLAGSGVAMTLDELLSTVPEGWIVGLAIGDRFALGVRPGGPTFPTIGGAVGLFGVRRDRYVILGVEGRGDRVIERAGPELVEIAVDAGDAVGSAFRVPVAIRLVSAAGGAAAEFRGRRVASSRTGVALIVVTPTGSLAGAYSAEMDEGLRFLVDPPSLSAAIASGREPCVDVSTDRWTDVSGVTALASLGGILSPGRTVLVYLGHSRPLHVRQFDVRHPWVPAIDVRAFEREDAASAAALDAALRSDRFEGASDLATRAYVYRVEATSAAAGSTQLALRLGGFAESAYVRVAPTGGAGPVALCAAMRGREALLAGRTAPARAAGELDLTDTNLFVFGWHSLERAGPLDFRWTRSHTAEVLVPLAHQPAVVLEIQAVPLLPEGATMQVRVNDVDLDQVDLVAGRQAYRWDVPVEAWRVGLNRVQILASEVIRPADLGMSDDDRPLGIAVSRLRLVPREETR